MQKKDTVKYNLKTYWNPISGVINNLEITDIFKCGFQSNVLHHSELLENCLRAIRIWYFISTLHQRLQEKHSTRELIVLIFDSFFYKSLHLFVFDAIYCLNNFPLIF